MQFSEESSLQWLPKRLTSLSNFIIESYLRDRSIKALDDLLWHKETMVFFATDKELGTLFRSGTRGLFMTKGKKEFLVLVVAILLSMEILIEDFAGWGLNFPLERSKAEAITAENFPSAKSRILNIVMPKRANLDSDTLSSFGP